MYTLPDLLADADDVVTTLLCDECGEQGGYSRETRTGLHAELMAGAWPMAALERLGGMQFRSRVEQNIVDQVCAACAAKREVESGGQPSKRRNRRSAPGVVAGPRQRRAKSL